MCSGHAECPLPPRTAHCALHLDRKPPGACRASWRCLSRCGVRGGGEAGAAAIHGAWSGWTPGQIELHEGPQPATFERRFSGATTWHALPTRTQPPNLVATESETRSVPS